MQEEPSDHVEEGFGAGVRLEEVRLGFQRGERMGELPLFLLTEVWIPSATQSAGGAGDCSGLGSYCR